MFKIGDTVVCKTFPKIVNKVKRDRDPNITIGKSYVIMEIISTNTDLKMLNIMGEKGLCWYWSDYFYSRMELRKLKIDKICSNLQR